MNKRKYEFEFQMIILFVIKLKSVSYLHSFIFVHFSLQNATERSNHFIFLVPPKKNLKKKKKELECA